MTGIFKMYDIRGIYPKQLNEELAYKIGYAISKVFNSKNILVCRDIRLGSEPVRNSIISGLVGSDKDISIVDAGLTTTPMFYYIFSQNTEFDFGIMITASHNPREYTGMKLLLRDSKGLKTVNFHSGIDKIEEFINKNKIEIKEINTDKNVEFSGYKQDYLEYIEKLSNLSKLNKKPKIVVDYSSGTAPVYSDFIKKTAEVIELNNVPDGNFPSHPPNPLLEDSQKELSETIIKENADFGMIFDGDADRIVFFDNKGKEVPVEVVIFLMIEQMKHENKPVSSVAYTINLSRELEDSLKKINISSYKSRIGYAFVRQIAIDNGSAFGAERSAHYSFKETGYLDSGILCYAYLLKTFVRNNKPFIELTKIVNIDTVMIEHALYLDSDEEKPIILNKSLEIFKETAKSYDDTDGHSFFFDDYWFNIRQSNTEPIIRVTIETDDRESNLKKFDEIKEKLIS